MNEPTIKGSIALGYLVEEDYLAELGLRSVIPEAELDWLAAWLEGEGWVHATHQNISVSPDLGCHTVAHDQAKHETLGD